MIIETIISTTNSNNEVNFAPFGIRKKNNFIFISPYIPSRTLDNLISNKCAVINYTNNPNHFVNCLIGKKKFQKLKENDFIVIFDVGAYGMSLSSNYNLRPKPAEILIKKSKVSVISKRQKIIEII